MYFTVLVDGQWNVSGLFSLLVDCSWKTEIILVDLWMDLKFYFCPQDDTDEPPSRGLSLDNPLTIRAIPWQSLIVCGLISTSFSCENTTAWS